MAIPRSILLAAGLAVSTLAAIAATESAEQAPAQAAQAADPIQILVDRLDLEKYKTTIKGLTQFGDRRQGTKRNRDALDWIEGQLKSYGCTNTERITYMHPSPEAAAPVPAGGAGRAAGGGQRGRGAAPAPLGEWNVRRNAEGGTTTYGYRGRISGVNTDPMNQANEALRALNAEPAPPVDPPSQRQQVYCTKIGATHPEEMYIVGAHMDGHGWGESANDNGSGTALVMELARVFHSPDVVTDRSIRFALWNNEETGLNGAWAYVNQRKDLQGRESPAGSGRYPEPKWLGMIQHDMMLWDHGAPRVDGSVSAEQRLEADVNIEFQSNSTMADGSMKLAFAFKAAADRYNKTYPAHVGPHMTNTDSTPFMNLVPAISLRENERGTHTGSGWNPTWHQPTDVFTTFSDKDFMLGLNAGMTTLSAVAGLSGARVK